MDQTETETVTAETLEEGHDALSRIKPPPECLTNGTWSNWKKSLVHGLFPGDTGSPEQHLLAQLRARKHR